MIRWIYVMVCLITKENEPKKEIKEENCFLLALIHWDNMNKSSMVFCSFFLFITS